MNRIELTNFRLFKKQTSFDIAPITVLTGRNNSGKSTLIKSLILLSDYFMSETDQTVLDLNGNNSRKHKINVFKNLKNWASNSKKVDFVYKKDEYLFKLSFSGQLEDTFARLSSFSLENTDINESLLLIRRSENIFSLQVSQKFIDQATKEEVNKEFLEAKEHLLKELKKIFSQLSTFEFDNYSNSIKSFTIKKSTLNELTSLGEFDSHNYYKKLIDEKQSLERRLKLIDTTIKVTKSKRIGVLYQADIDITDKTLANLSINNIIQQGLLQYMNFSKEYKAKSSADERRTLVNFSEKLSQLMNFPSYHLGPNRTYQSRLYNNYSNCEIDEIIAAYMRVNKGTKQAADKFIKTWLKNFSIGSSIQITPIEGMAYIVTVEREGNQVNLSDLGFGAGQLVTILLKIALAITELKNNNQARSLGKHIFIEEPEANLHPRLQSMLAELFDEVCKEYNLNFILETHSEYLLRNFQVLAKEYKGKHPFKIYYFDNDKGSYEMRMREDGKFLDEFGEGFFDESRKLAFKVL